MRQTHHKNGTHLSKRQCREQCSMETSLNIVCHNRLEMAVR